MAVHWSTITMYVRWFEFTWLISCFISPSNKIFFYSLVIKYKPNINTEQWKFFSSSWTTKVPSQNIIYQLSLCLQCCEDTSSVHDGKSINITIINHRKLVCVKTAFRANSINIIKSIARIISGKKESLV